MKTARKHIWNPDSLPFAIGRSSLGAVLVAWSPKGVREIALLDPADFRSLGKPSQEVPASVMAEVVRFVEAPWTALALPLDEKGTPFQRRVWQALREVPAGSTTSYSELAGRLGIPGSVRAVASACAANRIAVVTPCHRAIRSDGSLSGYRWGVPRKRQLLDMESRASVTPPPGARRS